MAETILEVEDFSGGFARGKDTTPTLKGISFSLRTGVTTAIVGETGSGKTLTALAMLGIAPKSFRATGGRILFEGADLLTANERTMRTIRGSKISMVFQDARSALNPVFTVGHQLRDACRTHQGLNRSDGEKAAVAMLDRVRIPDAARRMRQYPHEFSGGMAQRVMIAMALICRPRLLLLDEPTTGLDVTIQADIMDLVRDLTVGDGVTACLITHDLGIVAESCQDVVVLRDGEVREIASAEDIFTRPQDEYTKSLIEASRMAEPLP